jgi:hypothetical protein
MAKTFLRLHRTVDVDMMYVFSMYSGSVCSTKKICLEAQRKRQAYKDIKKKGHFARGAHTHTHFCIPRHPSTDAFPTTE